MYAVSILQKVVLSCVVMITTCVRGMDSLNVMHSLGRLCDNDLYDEQSEPIDFSSLWKVVKTGAYIGGVGYCLKKSGLPSELKVPLLVTFCAVSTYNLFKQDEVDMDLPDVVVPPRNKWKMHRRESS